MPHRCIVLIAYSAGGCCFDFNREQDYLFVVGAEDGSLYKCSTAYASEYLQVGFVFYQRYCVGMLWPAVFG